MKCPPPFRSLPDPIGTFAWGMYDLANQSFQLLINTLLFSLFVKEVLVTNPDKGAQVWSAMVASGMLIVVALSPFLGALADQRAWKRELLLISGVVCAVGTCLLGALEPGQVALGVALYLVAAIACGLGENFLGSFLPEIATPQCVGKVSAVGWSMSYIGALILLGITAAYTIWFDRPDIEQARPMFVFSGLWFLVGMVPAVLWLRERCKPCAPGGSLGSIVGGSVSRLIQSAKETARFKHLARFFGAFFVYSMGTLTVIYFLGIIGDGLGFGLTELIVMALVLAATAGISAAVVGGCQDRAGHKRTIAVLLLVWIGATLVMAGADLLDLPEWFFWIVAALIGIALGGIGTASRAIVGAFTPASRAGEFFGLWGMVYKLAGILGVVAFGQVSSRVGMPAALVVLSGFFAGGLLLLLRVNEREGMQASRDFEEDNIPAGGSPE